MDIGTSSAVARRLSVAMPILLGVPLWAFVPSRAVTVELIPQQQPEQMELTGAQAFSVVAGKVVGAASACDEISARRVFAAASKASRIASSSAADDADVAASQKLFADGDDYGRALVQSGRADCRSVEVSLASLESAEQR